MNTIKNMTITMLSAALLSTVSFTATAGVTADKLANAGFLCFPAGPHGWTHCLNANLLGKPAVPVKVFLTPEDGGQFLGTEQLIREDIYGGQPCPQDNESQWADPSDELPYYACHHFDTVHP